MMWNFSKLYEKLMYKQFYQHFKIILSSSQCRFWKVYIVQHSFLVMLDKLKEAVHNGKEFGSLLTDLSKVFDYIDLWLLLAMRYAYGVSHTWLKLIFSYFASRTQRTKINNCFSKSSKIEMDVSYECEDSDIENYPYDTTLCTCAPDTVKVISKLHSISDKLFNWFKYNHMKANPKKCYLVKFEKANWINFWILLY